MATEKDLEELLAVPPTFPFLTVYLDLGPQSRATRSFETVLRRRFSELEDLVEPGSEDAKHFWTDVKRVWDFVHNQLPSQGHGAAIFACSKLDGFWRAYVVSPRFETEVVLDDTPYVRPLAHMVEEHEHHLVVETRADRAIIWMVHLRTAEPVTRLYELASEVPAKTSQGGWSQRRFQWHRRDHILRHIKQVAEAVVDLDGQYNPKGIVLLGQDPNISELKRHLPERILQKIVAVAPEPAGPSEQELLDRVLPLLEFEERTEELSTLERILAELGRGGLAASGPEAVTAAAVEGRVDILLLANDFKAEGWRCLQCGAVMPVEAARGQCIYCGGELEKVELGEAVVQTVEQHGGQVEFMPRTEQLDRLDGIAALLRY